MYKTILLHIGRPPTWRRGMRAAADLAKEHEAHLIGLASTGYAVLQNSAAGAGAFGLYPPIGYDQFRSEARQRLQEYEQAAAGYAFGSVESRVIDDAAEYALALQSRYCDLVLVAGGATTEASPLLPGRLAGYLALHATRPVLQVATRAEPRLDGTVVIGWNGGAEASRAMAAALPLLRRAARVQIAVFNPDQGPHLHGDEPGADVARYLARHCSNVAVINENTSADPGEALLDLARSSGAGLIVAGAYGHSRFREWILGSTTACLLDQDEVAVLMTH
ncbi:universal stress protein [Pseudoduganella aquatica]|uniref:Universal stress protein n=1 Tax=Pseudoduganella aquatica TaxID=2660641 RepID=A0A7X4KNX8_9BURK|nr:universal stress protein [Pseudoduganella aquatica]MYN08606.1 universal stress protein [Pseudoduganella aquatica]